MKKIWDSYKNYVKSIDSNSKAEIEEIESIAAIIGAIVEQRNHLGLSQRELASLCDIPQSSVARIETFKSIPNLTTLVKIVRQLGLNLTITQNKA